MKRVLTCKICKNNSENKKYFLKENMKGTKATFVYFECSKCGCLQIKSFPRDIAKYYSSDYYSYSINNFNKLDNFIFKSVLNYILDYVVFNKGYFNKILFEILSYKYSTLLSLRAFSHVNNVSKNSRILDVGSGSGGKLYLLKNFGFKNVLGIDIFLNKDIHHENGLNILKRSIFDLNNKWDIIILNHSFEHMKNPEKVLKKINDLLNKRGVCIIRIPTTSSFAWKNYKENWIQLDAPRHYFIHSIESIKLLAKKSNLELEKYFYDSTAFQFWGSEQILNNIPMFSKKSYSINKKDSMFNNKIIKEYNLRAKKLNSENLGDQIVFYLRKIKSDDS
ncbi:MAG: class I SAM-dependent methyltransferase [archaeon]